MMSYIPFAALFFLLLWFGMNDLYQWSHKDIVALDPLVQHKSVFLNVPFFFARMILLLCALDRVCQETKTDIAT